MISFTPEAAEKLKAIIAARQRDDLALRVAVVPGGCRGFNYRMFLENNPRDGDEILQHDGFKVVVDPFSAMYLEGAEIGFDDSLMGGGFTVSNPNASSTCGCGQSFRTAADRGAPRSCTS